MGCSIYARRKQAQGRRQLISILDVHAWTRTRTFTALLLHENTSRLTALYILACVGMCCFKYWTYMREQSVDACRKHPCTRERIAGACMNGWCIHGHSLACCSSMWNQSRELFLCDYTYTSMVKIWLDGMCAYACFFCHATCIYMATYLYMSVHFVAIWMCLSLHSCTYSFVCSRVCVHTATCTPL